MGVSEVLTLGHGVGRRATVLGEEASRAVVECGVCLLRREVVELASWGAVLAPLLIVSLNPEGNDGAKRTNAALQRTSIHIVAVQLADCHSSVLMRIHLHE